MVPSLTRRFVAPCVSRGSTNKRGIPSWANNVTYQIADLAGYQRAIIHRNPPLVDEDGYDLESDDDDQHVQEVEAAAAEENPYSSVHLERTYCRRQAARLLLVTLSRNAH